MVLLNVHIIYHLTGKYLATLQLIHKDFLFIQLIELEQGGANKIVQALKWIEEDSSRV